MNTTPKEKQIQILKMLVEGSSIRSIERMTDVHRDTIMRLMVRVGNNCKVLLNNKMRGFHSKHIQVDEIWTFVKKKQRRLNKTEKLNDKIGDQYAFIAIDAETKLIPSFVVGKRTRETAFRFLTDLRNKLNGNGRIQITSDGFPGYFDNVGYVFGNEVDFAQLVKIYESEHAGRGRYAPPKVSETVSTVINGNPDPKKNLNVICGKTKFDHEDANKTVY